MFLFNAFNGLIYAFLEVLCHSCRFFFVFFMIYRNIGLYLIFPLYVLSLGIPGNIKGNLMFFQYIFVG